MLLPPLKLILGCCGMILMMLYVGWSNRRNKHDYYETINSLSRHFSGALDKKRKFWYDLPAFVGVYSGFQFTALYGQRGWLLRGNTPQILWLYCRRLTPYKTGEFTKEELRKRQHQQLIAEGWTFDSCRDAEIRAYSDAVLPLPLEMIKRTLENLEAVERKDIKIPQDIMTARLEDGGSKVKLSKGKTASVLNALVNVLLIGIVYDQVGGIFAYVIAAILIVEGAAIVLYNFSRNEKGNI